MSRMLVAYLSAGLCLSPAAGAKFRTTFYTYTSEGLIASIDGPRTDVADVTSFTYDAAGNRAVMNNALGHVTRYVAYDANGRLLRMIDPNGLETRFTYHPRGWLESHTVSGDGSIATTAYEYDTTGNLVQMTLPSGSRLQLTYDAASRLTAITDNEGNQQRYTLDNVGNRIAEEFRGPGNAVTRSLSRVYDTLNRLRQQLGATRGRETTISYDANGNVTDLTDGLSRSSSYLYDPLNRLIRSLDAAGGETGFVYDSRNNLTKTVDPLGNATLYEYNAFDEKTSQVSPDTGSSGYSYDAAGNLTSMTDARGITVSYGYDALNRLTSILYPDSSLDVTFVYDQGAYGLGRLTRMIDANGATEYRYDQRGNLVREIRNSAELELITDYEYDTFGQLTKLTYPSGHKVHYQHDAQGRPRAASLEGPDGHLQTLVDDLTYLPFGPAASMEFGNGLKLALTFDEDYRLIHEQTSAISDTSYEIDPADNILAWRNLQNPDRDQTFGYDALDRLQSAKGPFGELAFSYDSVGNRASSQINLATEEYLYTNENSRLLEIVGGMGDVFTYDQAGNTTSSTKGEFFYEPTGRLSRFMSPGVDAAYAYNGVGERIRKTVNGVTTHFHYVGSQLVGEYKDSGALIREYVYLDGRPIGIISAPPSPSVSDTVLQKVSTWQNWTPVALGDFDERPIVITGPPSLNGREAAVVALRNVNPVSAEVTIREWDSLDGSHTFEQLSLLAMPPGRYPQPDGSVWEFGRVTVSGTQSWHTVNFHASFDSSPAVFATIQTTNDTDTVTARVRRVTASSFDVALFEEEIRQNGHAAEEIGYLAIHPASRSRSGFVTLRGATIDYQIDSAELDERPAIIAGANLRLQEEQSRDSETNHRLERVDVLRLGGHIFAQDVTSRDSDTASIRTTTVLPDTTYRGGQANNRRSDLYFVHTDHLGAPIKVTDQNGLLVWDVDRLPFGKLDILIAETEMPLRFPGQYFDAESGLYYNYYRDYDPSTGRYIQSDPIGLAGGFNTYAYVGGNPIRYSDPLGLFQFATRPLGGSQYQSPLWGNNNLWHEHGFFEDGSGDNIGYGPHGMFGDDSELKDSRYRYFGPHYDDDIMRRAIDHVRNSQRWQPATPFFSLPSMFDYDLSGHNCQDFADDLRDKYNMYGGTTCDEPFQNRVCHP